MGVLDNGRRCETVMQVEKTVTLRADASAVWDALTNPQLTKKYFFGCEAISDWKVGSSLIFRFELEGKEIIPVKGVITAIEPNRFLQHTCFASEFEDVPANHTTVNYTLASDGGVTEVSVTQGDFKDEAKFREHNASWDQVLSGLKALLEG